MTKHLSHNLEEGGSVPDAWYMAVRLCWFWSHDETEHHGNGHMQMASSPQGGQEIEGTAPGPGATVNGTTSL